MRTLIEKEIRLLLPAFGAALVLAAAPIWFLGSFTYLDGQESSRASYAFLFGIALLALSSFGREIGLKTLPFTLAQPLQRGRIWRTKVVVLVIFVTITFATWWLSEIICGYNHPTTPFANAEANVKAQDFLSPQVVVNAALLMTVLTASGLWMTLLLRQVSAALWLTLLIPVATTIAMQAVGCPDWFISVILGLYAAAGFFLAKRQFFCIQDTPWTGGVVSLSRAHSTAKIAEVRKHKPWEALTRKELQLHQFTLAGMAALLVLHLGVVMLRKFGAHDFGKTTLSALEMFGGVWLIVPLVAAGQSVAEERQLGILDGLLCLPVSRRAQFTIKLIFVIVLGGLCSAALLCGVEEFAQSIGAAADLKVMDISFTGVGVFPIFLVFTVLAMIGFYASTLTRSLVQAMATGLAVIGMFSFILTMAQSNLTADAFGFKLWLAIGCPALAVAVLWLSYGNFRWVFESRRRWRRNIFGLIAVMAVVSVSAAAIFHRVWERFTPLEKPHGAAALPAGKPILFGGYYRNVAMVLPGGKLWADRDSAKKSLLNLADHGHFLSGTNWQDVMANLSETVAIRSNGTLWVSAEPLQWPWFAEDPPEMVQFGAETNWQSVARYSSWSVVLLKQDGTLWRWGTNADVSKVSTYKNPGLRSLKPQRLGADSDWTQIAAGVGQVYGWKRDGKAWTLRAAESGLGPVRMPGDRTDIERAQNLDGFRFKSLNTSPNGWPEEIGVREDGTLWDWSWYSSRVEAGSKIVTSRPTFMLRQIGQTSNWVAVASSFDELVALKTDGSIWEWNLPIGEGRPHEEALQSAPIQLGTNTDWVGLGNAQDKIIALAADGTLWNWPSYYDLRSRWHPEQWIAVSRRPHKIKNIFDSGN